jgi:predicted ATP-grasp superfamily ATP-dependent carboligase
MKSPVFILSLFDTGYYAARLLKKTGIPIYGFDHDPQNPGFYSKYLKAFVVPQPQADPDAVLALLLKKRHEFSMKPVLIAASENYLEFMQRRRFELEKDFLFRLPAEPVLKQIIDRSAQFALAAKCGISVPDYQVIATPGDLKNALAKVEFPVVLKGVDQPLWKRLIRRKAFVVENEIEFNELGSRLLAQQVSFMAQRIVEGDCSNNYEFNALVFDGKIVESNMNRKQRQYPLDFGSACCLRTVKNEPVEKLAVKFLMQNSIEGFSNTEFKFDKKTGDYCFIETNARVWQQVELTKKNNQNFVLAYYDRLTKNGFRDASKAKATSIGWIDLPTDLLVFLRYRRRIGLSLPQFMKSTISASNRGLFSLRDIKPFLKAIHILK